MHDGRARYMRVSGEALFGPDGGFTGYRGVGRDVTDEKRAEQILRLEHEVARLLAAAEDAAERPEKRDARGVRDRRLGLRPLLPRRQGGVLRFQEAWAIDRCRHRRSSSSARAASSSAGPGPDRHRVAVGRRRSGRRHHAGPARARPQRAGRGTGMRGAFAVRR